MPRSELTHLGGVSEDALLRVAEQYYGKAYSNSAVLSRLINHMRWPREPHEDSWNVLKSRKGAQSPQLPDFLAFSSDSDRSKGETGSCCKSMHLLSLCFCFFGWPLLPVPSSATSHACSRAVIQWLGGTFVVTVLLGF